MSALPPITDIGRRNLGCQFMGTRPRTSLAGAATSLRGSNVECDFNRHTPVTHGNLASLFGTATKSLLLQVRDMQLRLDGLDQCVDLFRLRRELRDKETTHVLFK